MAGKFFDTAHPHTLTDIRLTLLTQIDIFWEKPIQVLAGLCDRVVALDNRLWALKSAADRLEARPTFPSASARVFSADFRVLGFFGALKTVPFVVFEGCFHELVDMLWPTS